VDVFLPRASVTEVCRSRTSYVKDVLPVSGSFAAVFRPRASYV
jgi:hypothetical protein